MAKKTKTLKGAKNTLYYGDNLHVMQRYLADASVDLIYLDPPFKSDKNYNVLFKKKSDEDVANDDAQILAFTDTWSWGPDDKESYELLISKAEPQVATVVYALYRILGPSDMMSYIVMMAPRLIEMKRILKPTGSIYLHCDMSASHYLKVLMDAVFGVENFLNNVVWLYGLGGSSKRYWPRKHDDLLWYSRSPDKHFFEADKIPATSQRLKGKLKKAPDYWDIPAINNMAKERMGYPTQKPLELLERVVRSSCPENGVVLDPFCGCGTAVVAAQSLGRSWIGIDVSFLAVELMRERIDTVFSGVAVYDVNGIPTDEVSAFALHERDPFEFERWAVSAVDGHPNDRQVGDRGEDGRIRYWHDHEELREMTVSVKGGRTVNPGMIRDLRGTMERLGRDMGLLITNQDPTPGMREEAASAGQYTHPISNRKYPRIQIITAKEILKGERPDMPTVESPYRRAATVDSQLEMEFDES